MGKALESQEQVSELMLKALQDEGWQVVSYAGYYGEIIVQANDAPATCKVAIHPIQALSRKVVFSKKGTS